MASGQGGQLEVGVSGASSLAKPLYLQRLERSLKLDSFLRQTAAIFNRDITRYRKRGADGGHSVVASRLRFVLATYKKLKCFAAIFPSYQNETVYCVHIYTYKFRCLHG